jgi:hypothetical protein
MKLPVATFAELALDLHVVACDGIQTVAAMEASSARYRRAGLEAGLNGDEQEHNWRLYAEGVAKAARSVKAATAAHELFKEFADYEDDIRALIASKTRSEAA